MTTTPNHTAGKSRTRCAESEPHEHQVTKRVFVIAGRGGRGAPETPKGYKASMRFRLGFALGAALGYYLGAMAGQERYEQINRMLKRAGRSQAFDVATGKAKAVVDLGVERARDVVETKIGGGLTETRERERL